MHPSVPCWILSVLILFSGVAYSQTKALHPRGIISADELPVLREKIKKKTYRAMYENLLRVAKRQQEEQTNRPYEPYADSDLLGNQAYLYLLTGDQTWAEGAWQIGRAYSRR